MAKEKPLKPCDFNGLSVAGAEGLEPSARGFGDLTELLEFQRLSLLVTHTVPQFNLSRKGFRYNLTNRPPVSRGRLFLCCR